MISGHYRKYIACISQIV